MGCSSSQLRTDRVHSPINAFSLEDLYTPDFSDSFQENNGYLQEPGPYEFPVEQVATSPTNKKKATRNRQKMTIQSEDAPRQTPWTIEEENAFCKAWFAISENSKHGNSRKQGGFWVEVLGYIESKTQQYRRRTYDMIIGKWKTVRRSVVRFCGIYNNVIRIGPVSGAGDADYIERAMNHYEIETGLPFKVAIVGSINLNTNVGDNNKNEVQKTQRPQDRDKAKAAGKKKGSKLSASTNVNEDALARLMVTEMTAQGKQERLAILDIKRREVECCEQKIEQQDMMLYLQPYGHLTGDQRKAMDAVRGRIKAKYNLKY
nr:hypothetical protein [Tanacetum cinerariifolium]